MSNNNHSGDRKFFTLIAVWVALIAATGYFVQSPFLLTLAAFTSVLALFALSVNLMLGGVGEVPLGQCLFFGVGAYGVGIGMKSFGLSYEMGLLAGVLVAIPVSAVIGALTLRLTGAYFSIVSWGLASVAVVVTVNLEHLTGGSLGLFGMSSMALLGLDMGTPRSYFFACAALLVAVIVLLNAVRSSRFGAALESVRQNRHLASSLGINVFRHRLLAFVLSASIGALAGGLSVPYTQIVTPEAMAVTVTVDALLMVLLGGTRCLFGPVLGAMIFSILPFYLEMDVNVRILVFSVAIILIMMFVPGGLHQLGQGLLARFKGSRHVRV